MWKKYVLLRSVILVLWQGHLIQVRVPAGVAYKKNRKPLVWLKNFVFRGDFEQAQEEDSRMIRMITQ